MSNGKIRIIAKEIELIRNENGDVITSVSKPVTQDFEVDLFCNPFRSSENRKFEIVSAEIFFPENMELIG